MHFVLTYDLSAGGTRRAEIETSISQVLEAYPHVRRLSTFYVVHVDTSSQWDSIRVSLTNLSRDIPENLHFIMSPLIEGGRYNGILPEGQWDEINVITNLD